MLLTAGCSDPSTGPTDGGTTAAGMAAWTSTDPVDTSGLIWAADGVVHLSDGTTIDVGGPLTTYVVAGDGVWFTPAESEESAGRHSSTSTGPLHFAGRDGTVSDTGVTVYVESIGSSPDGRYLGFVDATSGPEDDFSGQPRGTAIVVDTTTGERVVETADGMGDPDEDDLEHDYPEVYLGVRFPDNGAAVVEGLGDFFFTLPDGEGEPLESGFRRPSDPVSPDGEWTIQDRGFDDRVVSANGAPVPIRTGTPRRDLRWWLDEATVVGIAIAGPGAGQDLGPDNTATLVTCEVPEGACARVDGTAGARVRFPVGAGDEGLDLGRPGGGS
ncbi:hypothetical protein ASC64_01700 [Nocardioides sp. Root122]|nr:hypothetical protein ASC64_01700 [Nocardioides sp. Root122]